MKALDANERSFYPLRVFWLACLTLLFQINFSEISSAKSLAFSVGVNEYQNLQQSSQLRNATNDAVGFANKFRDLNYDEVIHKNNVGRMEFYRIWDDFLDLIEEGDTVVFFFSGHGIQIEGTDYLLPSDIPAVEVRRQKRVHREAIDFNDLYIDVINKGPRFAIFILDACRDNPFVPPGYKGFTPVGLSQTTRSGIGSSGTESFVMYSADSGQISLDRLPDETDSRKNSIFTRNLLSLIGDGSKEIREIAVEVKHAVSRTLLGTNHIQNPSYTDGMIEEFCFVECKGIPDTLIRQTSPLGALVISHFPRLDEVLGILRSGSILPPLYAYYKDESLVLRVNNHERSLAEKEDIIAHCYSKSKCKVIISETHQEARKIGDEYFSAN